MVGEGGFHYKTHGGVRTAEFQYDRTTMLTVPWAHGPYSICTAHNYTYGIAGADVGVVLV